MKNLIKQINRITTFLSNILEIGFKNRDVMKYGDCYITIKKFLKHHKPNVIYDIGSNSGDWSYVMHKLNKNIDSIVFFEPQSKFCHKIKKINFSYPIEKKIYNIALGNEDGIAEIKGGTASASILDINEQNIYFPNSLKEDLEKVEIKKLDDIVYSDKLKLPDTIKIDVQGYELFILEGSEKVLKNTKYIILELSFREFYLNQPALSKILNFMEKNNFMLVDFGYEWRDIQKNEIIQIDAFFLNKIYK